VAAALTAAKLSLAGAKAYGTAKAVGRPALKVAVPVVVAGGGVVVWRLAHKGSSNGASADADVGRPLGPVASADTVSPPADAAVQTAGSEAQAQGS